MFFYSVSKAHFFVKPVIPGLSRNLLKIKQVILNVEIPAYAGMTACELSRLVKIFRFIFDSIK